MRPSGRQVNQLRHISMKKDYTQHAEGSVLICCGETKVLCNASVETRVPHFLRNSGQGWVTAEYSMLPRATHTRNQREASRGKQSGRTLEISRLIGRSLRAAVDLSKLGEHTITLDCDVIQADGGTRTASITGAYVALCLATKWMKHQDMIDEDPVYGTIAAVSVGIFDGQAVLDLDYAEDSQAETDMNIVMNDAGHFIEVQGTAEGHAFSRDELNTLLSLAESGIGDLMKAQRQALNG